MAVNPNNQTYFLVLAHENEDGFVIINTGQQPMPLAPLALLDNNNQPVISGTDWQVDTLRPGECVGVYLQGVNPKIPGNVKCQPTGKVIITTTAFWTNPVNVQYNGTSIGSCPLAPAKCALNTQPQ